MNPYVVAAYLFAAGGLALAIFWRRSSKRAAAFLVDLHAEQTRRWRLEALLVGDDERPLTQRQAVQVISDYSARSTKDVFNFPGRAVREARAATHPNLHGGRTEAWDLVNRAASVLPFGDLEQRRRIL